MHISKIPWSRNWKTSETIALVLVLALGVFAASKMSVAKPSFKESSPEVAAASGTQTQEPPELSLANNRPVLYEDFREKYEEEERGSEEERFRKMTIADLINGPRPNYAEVTGRVYEVFGAPDGDIHVHIEDAGGNVLVTEIMPELPLPKPFVGQKIAVWGLVHYDFFHQWWEIHPVFGWRDESKEAQ